MLNAKVYMDTVVKPSLECVLWKCGLWFEILNRMMVENAMESERHARDINVE